MAQDVPETNSRSFKDSSISRLQARTAAKAVKKAKSTGGVARKNVSSSLKTGRFMNASAFERYLGNFGVGRSKTQAKKASSPKVQDGRSKSGPRGTRA
jgi:hypothetical protein